MGLHLPKISFFKFNFSFNLTMYVIFFLKIYTSFKSIFLFIRLINLYLILVFGFGLLPLAILIYLELGEKDEDTYER